MVITTGNSSIKTVNAIVAQMVNKPSVVTRRKYQSGNYYWIINGKKHISSKNSRFDTQNLIINFGCPAGISSSVGVINPVKAINNMCNKYETRMILKDEDVNIPCTYDGNDMDDDGELFYVPLIKRPMHHSRGIDFEVIPADTFIYQSNHYYSEIYPKQREVRVHVAHGKVLLMHEKSLSSDHIQANHFITGEEWRVIPWSEYELDVCKIACNAVKAVGASFGAVDVMIDRRQRSNNQVCVCEINSAPSFENSEYTVLRYARYFDWLIRNPDAEWWPYETYTKAKSYAWKNVHLDGGSYNGEERSDSDSSM